MQWNPLSPGWLASGKTSVYLVTRNADNHVILTRWSARPNPAAWEVAREAAHNAVRVTSPDAGKQIADSFEAGFTRSTPGWAAWARSERTRSL